jgi:ketosteroid isomerase-like protein
MQQPQRTRGFTKQTKCSFVFFVVTDLSVGVEWARNLQEALVKTLLPILLIAFMVTVVLLPIRPTVSASPKATVEMLKQLEGEFMKAAAEKGSQGYMSYYADDAVELPNAYILIQGKAEIAKTMGFLDDKNNRLTWTPVGADIASSGDIGYTYGNYQFHSKDKEGKLAVQYGKYTSIWKLQKDGSWKVVLDMGNASPEPKS